jgi:FtsP/CotA-like multicopper oxidase with cupredoxin domain
MSDAARNTDVTGLDAISDAEPQVDQGGISRRRFLQGTGLAIAAVGVGAYARSPRARGATASPDPSADPLLRGDLADVTETWTEPRVWKPLGSEPLRLNVVEDEGGLRFSYDGESPGPTIRMSGDETLYVRIQNDLGEDRGISPVGPNPDPLEGYPGPEGAMLKTLKSSDQYGDGLNQIPTKPQPDWSLGEHTNGLHSAHVTNLHTHGLHVAPGKNDNGTSSDDIYLRIVSKRDAVKIAKHPGLYQKYQESRDEIIDHVADFEFRLGDVMQGLVGPDGQALSGVPHPPGTYWYHPHSHGATQNQVASGMAGFLIIEGDVDALVNERIAGNADAKWDVKTGDWDYRERDMLLQRVFLAPTDNISGPVPGLDPDALKKKRNSIHTLINGKPQPDRIRMRPGAIERWRVLNGSVDGAGYMRLAVLAGRFFTVKPTEGGPGKGLHKLFMLDDSGGSKTEMPVTVNDYQPLTVNSDSGSKAIEKAHIWQLAWDGVTLVRQDSAGSWTYQVRDLATVNDGQEPNLERLTECYRAANIPLCYRRPNELAMADANRADIFFQAPPLVDGAPAVYTIVSLPTRLNGTPEGNVKVLAHVVVSGDDVPGQQDYPFGDLLTGLAVSPYEIPVSDEEIQVKSDAERAAKGIGDGTAYRTRVVRYAGFGAKGLPFVQLDDDYVSANPLKGKLSYYKPPHKDSTHYTLPITNGGKKTTAAVTQIERFPSGDLPTVLLAANTRTMNIDGQKFYPTSETTPKMLLNTSEEWVVYNQSVDVYSVPPAKASWTTEQKAEYITNNPELVYYQFQYVDGPPSGSKAPTSPLPYYGSHQISYAMTQAQADAVNAARASASGDPWSMKGQLEISGGRGAADHPFHIHQNPFWLTRIDVPDENGDMVNILPEPQWADTVSVPRNGGRAVFRSRFVDYEGEFVEHCHILLHEDNGMMQRLQVIGNAAHANYEVRDAVVGPDASAADVNEIYAKPSLAESWARSVMFVDGNPNTGQVYPGEGFIPSPPTPPTE